MFTMRFDYFPTIIQVIMICKRSSPMGYSAYWRKSFTNHSFFAMISGAVFHGIISVHHVDHAAHPGSDVTQCHRRHSVLHHTRLETFSWRQGEWKKFEYVEIRALSELPDYIVPISRQYIGNQYFRFRWINDSHSLTHNYLKYKSWFWCYWRGWSDELE